MCSPGKEAAVWTVCLSTKDPWQTILEMALILCWPTGFGQNREPWKFLQDLEPLESQHVLTKVFAVDLLPQV
jgi:hypothetical protein